MRNLFPAQHRQAPLDGETAAQETPEPTPATASKSPGFGVTGKFPAAAVFTEDAPNGDDL